MKVIESQKAKGKEQEGSQDHTGGQRKAGAVGDGL